MNQILTIEFDGGCRPTNPGNKYGSFQVGAGDLVLHKSIQFELGWGTSNEAEFEALLAALHWIREQLEQEGYPPARYRLQLLTDSMVLRNRIAGHTKTCATEPQQRMARLARKCLECLRQFGDFDIKWRSRDHNVARFGH